MFQHSRWSAIAPADAHTNTYGAYGGSKLAASRGGRIKAG